MAREDELRIQALGAALSRRDWHATEQAYEALRDAATEQAHEALRDAARFEKTPAGVIDWKAEAIRANRLLAVAERAVLTEFARLRKVADDLTAPARPERTGFFESLTPEQQKAALEYDGPENHGDPAFARPLDKRDHEDAMLRQIVSERDAAKTKV